MKQLEVQILGHSYLLGCPEGGEARMLEAVERVDSAMCAIRDAGKIKARDRIAVLAALNLAFDAGDRLKSVAPTATTVGASQGVVHHHPLLGKEAEDALLASILERLDDALADDGRLL